MEPSVNQLQLEQKSYQMSPQERFTVAYFADDSIIEVGRVKPASHTVERQGT